MAAGFKAQIQRDIKAVFHNESEFAETMEVRYNGRDYEIPIVLDYEGAKDRKQPSSDHADGIFVVDVTAYIALNDIGVVPQKNKRIEIGGDVFNIIQVSNEAGEIILDLEMLDE